MEAVSRNMLNCHLPAVIRCGRIYRVLVLSSIFYGCPYAWNNLNWYLMGRPVTSETLLARLRIWQMLCPRKNSLHVRHLAQGTKSQFVSDFHSLQTFTTYISLLHSRMGLDWIGFGYAALVASGGMIGYAKAGIVLMSPHSLVFWC